MECITCNSKNVVRNGYYKSYQKYKCKDCNKQFTERSFSFFCRHRFPDEVIRNTILYTMFISTRITKFIVQETMNFYISHVSAYNWSKKFAYHVSKLKRSDNFSNIWHVDEKFIKCRNVKDNKSNVKFSYLWVIIDSNNNIISTYVSHERNIRSAKIALRRAKDRAKKPPDIIVSDGLQAYKKACKHVFGRKTKHIIAHFETKSFMYKGRLYYLSNNRIESLNSKINLWYKRFRGFKSLASARLWCDLFNYFYDYMRPRVIEHKIISIHEVIK